LVSPFLLGKLVDDRLGGRPRAATSVDDAQDVVFFDDHALLVADPHLTARESCEQEGVYR